MSSALLNKKIKYWEHQLLDLGKRNRMINYRETKRSTLKLIEPSFSDLFQKIAINEDSLTFQRPIDKETDIRVFSILSLLEHLSSPLPVTIGDIKTEGSMTERQKTLKNLRSKSRLSLEEQGTNILYLSFGFIEWCDGKGSSARWIKSPLILVPAVLTVDSLNSPYTLSKYEDDIVINPTLKYYLSTEYGIELPPFDIDKDRINEYLDNLEELADQNGWRILKDVDLGLLSFLKISMYNDLIRNEKRIKKNPVIKAMAGDSDEVNTIPKKLQTFDLDSIKAHDCYQVMSADSSQQDAILYSKNNISFVMQGPPGTGKSQTITNIIAEALADGKRILFVSEKMAALQVVYRRLQDVHLADFCLPLHSYKANKKEILEKIGENLKLKQTRVKDEALNSLEELSFIRDGLNQYANELHQPTSKLDISCYEVYSKLQSVDNVPYVSFPFTNPLEINQTQLENYISSLEEYSLSIQRIKYKTHNNPWEGLCSLTTVYEYIEKMRTTLDFISQSIDGMMQCIEKIKDCSNCVFSLSYDMVPTLDSFIKSICKLPPIPNNWLHPTTLSVFLAEAQAAKIQSKKLSDYEKEIGDIFNINIFNYDYNAWKTTLFSYVNDLLELPYINISDPNVIIQNVSILQQDFTDIRESLSSINMSTDSINHLLGIHIIANTSNLQYLEDIFSLIQNNNILPYHWFTSDIGKIQSLIEEAKTNAEKLFAIKANILTDWEPDILQLDYSPILLRFKTDYTNFLKVFKIQYRNDKKQFQALSKTILKKISDEMIVDILFKLQDYHEKIAWFEEKEDALSDALSLYYNGITSKWDDALTAIDILQKLKVLPSFMISQTLVTILSQDHSDTIANLNTLLSITTSAFQKIAKITDDNVININVYAIEFNSSIALSIVNNYIDLLDCIKEQASYITPYLINEKTPIDTIAYEIDTLNAYDSLLQIYENCITKYKYHYDFLFQNRTTNWDNIILLLNQINDITQSSIYDQLYEIVNIDSFKKEKIRQYTEQMVILYSQSINSMKWLCGQFSEESFNTNMLLENISFKVKNCLLSIDMIKPWIDYQEAKTNCFNNSLKDFIEIIESNNIHKDIEKIFLKGFYHMWLESAYNKFDSVRRFRKDSHNEHIKEFIKLDDLQLIIAQMRIREKLIKNLPTEHRLLKATDEVAILKKELTKKRRIMPLRKLFRLIPNLLMQLKPCLMMSPLSVSYFLETEAYHFDLVIFDEASQIFPEDAIGAIFRGSQVIIAGDSKQLPPTNFFATTTNSFDNNYDINEEDDNYTEIVSDSILEEAASVLPNRTLLWHYRSKNEGLIAFSNREIYKNELITFPDSITKIPDMGVEYIYVENGYYEGGGKNCNIREAQKCVMLVLKHIQQHPDRSLGIIAFSEKQQTTIENAIIDLREKAPQYEWFFDESRDEPFFVKNLENVQGDERDTIIFSICYAKDRNGKMYMRFGPLSHEGGERRLNVAITRAKYNIKLVGSILPSEIDLTRTNSEGVKMLKDYIEYAQKGPIALKPLVKKQSFETEDEFCSIIVDFLEHHGYQVKTKVGCSDYKIDIAIVNPYITDEYIAGIECDGFSYMHAKTVRDRDHLRKSVLQNMGWNLYRVWSTEWIRNPKAEEKALLDYLSSLIDENGSVKHFAKSSNNNLSNTSVTQIVNTATKMLNEKNADNPYGFAYYSEANPQDAPFFPIRFYNSKSIMEDIKYVVSIEQPIHKELLYKRMGMLFEVGKATERVKTNIDNVIKNKLKRKIKIDQDNFVWLLPQNPIDVRIPNQHNLPRPIEHIHTQEIALAMIAIVNNSYGITEEELSSECARIFGFERRGPKIKLKLDEAICWLVKNHKIRFIDGKAQIIHEK